MKKLSLILALLAITTYSKAGGPIFFKAGVMGLAANTWLVSTDFTTGSGLTYQTSKPQMTWSTNFGVVGSIHFTDLLGVEVEGIFGKYKQDFKVDAYILGLPIESSRTTEISKIDVPVLVKLGKLVYFEVGPQFTFISKVEEVSSAGSIDNTSLYASSQIYGVAGMGINIGIPKIVQFEAGLRGGYGFNDMRNSGSGTSLYNAKVYSAFWGVKLMAVHKF